MYWQGNVSVMNEPAKGSSSQMCKPRCKQKIEYFADFGSVCEPNNFSQNETELRFQPNGCYGQAVLCVLFCSM